MSTKATKTIMPTMSGYRRRLQDKREYVFSRLFELGLSALELARPEANYLPSVLHAEEKIGGVIAGQSDKGHMMIIATDERVIVLDCKPFFTDTEDIGYDFITGVEMIHSGPFYTVSMKTNLGEFTIYTLYEKAARSFGTYLKKQHLRQSAEIVAVVS